MAQEAKNTVALQPTKPDASVSESETATEG